MRTDKTIYSYRQRGNSITTNFKIKNINDIVKNVTNMNELLKKETLKSEDYLYCKKAISMLVYHGTSIYGRLDVSDKDKAYSIIKNELINDAMKYPFDKYQKKKFFVFKNMRLIFDYIYELKNKRR